MTKTAQNLTSDDLYEGRPSTSECGCSRQAGEPMEAVAEPLEAAAERFEAAAEKGIFRQVTTNGICRPPFHIEVDPKAMQACQKLASRIGRFESSKQLYEFVRENLERKDQECYVIVGVDTQLMYRCYTEIAKGARDRVLTPIQDTARYMVAFALIYGCQGFGIAHNHPSGKAHPSEADEDVTKAVMRMAEANELLFLDHIVIGRDTGDGEPAYYSFRDSSNLFKKTKRKS